MPTHDPNLVNLNPGVAAKAVLPYLKAYAALAGSVCTALLGTYGPDTKLGHILTIVAAVATAVTTFAIPNLDPAAIKQDESVQPPAAPAPAADVPNPPASPVD